MHPYHNYLRSKYYQLNRKIQILIDSGKFYLLKARKRFQLLKRLLRLRERLIRLDSIKGNIALISGSALMMGSVAHAQPEKLNFFASEAVQNPFGLSQFVVSEDVAPVFVDIDRDGDFDLFVGGGEYVLKFFENSGTSTEPIFNSYQSNPFGIGLNGEYQLPTFADIDGDGDLDLFSGGSNYIEFQENIGTASAPYFTGPVSQPFGLATETVSTTSSTESGLIIADLATPTFGDIDNDGDLDAFIGDVKGNILFFENTGNATSASFVHNSDTALNVFEGGEYSPLFAAPVLCDIDADGDLDMIVGQLFGYTVLNYNDNSDISNTYLGIVPFSFDGEVSGGARPAPVDIDGDGDLDMFVGDSKGALNFFPGRFGVYDGYAGEEALGLFINAESTAPFGMIRYSGTNHTMVDIDEDGDLDMFHIDDSGTLFFQENVGTMRSPSFGAIDSSPYSAISFYAGGEGESPGHIAFVDFDYDGDIDAIVQDTFTGDTRLFLNDPNSSGAFFSMGFYINNPSGLRLPDNADFNFIDLDEDGDLDVFYTANDSIGYALNIGDGDGGETPNNFDNTYNNVYKLYYNNVKGAPQFADLDSDGDLELILTAGVGGESPVNILVYSIDSSDFSSVGFPGSCGATIFLPSFFDNTEHLSLVDLDSDGDLDALMSNEAGYLYFLENINCVYDMNINHFLPHRSFITAYNETKSEGRVPVSRDIILEAGGEVNLLPGFEVLKDNISPIENPTLEVQIGGCSELIDLPQGGGGGGGIPASIDNKRRDVKEEKASKSWNSNKLDMTIKKKELFTEENLDKYPALKKLMDRYEKK